MEIKKEQLATLIQLQEKMEVIELQYAYVRSVDKRDWQTSLDVFHTDGKLFVVDSGERQLIGGKPEIESFFKEIADRDFIFSRHSISNPIATLKGKKAYFSSYYQTTFIHPTYTKVIFGYYDDKLLKENGQWKLLEKQIILGWSDFLLPLSDLKKEK